MMKCHRPEWSNEENDYCDCDSSWFQEAIAEGDVPCEACIYWRDTTDV